MQPISTGILDFHGPLGVQRTNNLQEDWGKYDFENTTMRLFRDV